MEMISSKIGSARIGSANPVGQLPVALLSVGLLELALPLLPLELVPGVVVVVQVLEGVSASLVATSPSWHYSPPRTEHGWLRLASLDDETFRHKVGPC